MEVSSGMAESAVPAPCMACCGKHWYGHAPSVVGGARSLPLMNSFESDYELGYTPPVSMLFSVVFLARSSEGYKFGS
jgi:hypothetical protein